METNLSRRAATRGTPSTAFAVGHQTGKRRAGKKSGGEINNLEIIQDCYAIYRRIKKEPTLTHVAAHTGNEGNELADARRCSACSVKKKNSDRIRKK